MKSEMRVTWMRVGDPNPQTAGWFCPQTDSISTQEPVRQPNRGLMRFHNEAKYATM